MPDSRLPRLQRIFRDVLDEPSLQLAEDFSTAAHPEWDSVVMVQIVLAVEQEFGCELEMAQVAEIKSVADILRCLP
ncbi:acyl carrier protein [Ruficoccus amylovorans]|uniref:Acyl carrier protein n=1 Tax=Ruficoccus amylovorans TaxID=1804625 RepID=A0A842HFH7_9BACT|nr:acyl carrier protein [Ruficoccus amylovorans]MBC2594327.1 acyl carrier protein [Ruficoccus amylovorans]